MAVSRGDYMNKIAWEKTNSEQNAIWHGRGDYVSMFDKLVDSCFLKNVACAKMWTPVVVSGSFNETECFFDPLVALMIEEKEHLKLYAVYKLSFADEGEEPNLMIRSAHWDSKIDCENFAKASDKPKYLLADEQLTINNIFVRNESYEKLNLLIENIETILLSGVKFKKHQRLDSIYHSVRIKCENQNIALINDIDYSPLVLENSVIEKWLLDWKDYFETEKFEKNFQPDADIQISYKTSLPELLNMK
jgi:hypothetical protein